MMTKSFQDILRQRTSQSPQILDVIDSYDDPFKKICYIRHPEGYVVPVETNSPQQASDIAKNSSFEDARKRSEEPQKIQDEHTYSKTSSALWGATDGATSGLSEKLGALLYTSLWLNQFSNYEDTGIKAEAPPHWNDTKTTYKTAKKQLRQMRRDAERSNPKTYLMGNLAGSTILPGTRELKGVSLLAKGLKKISGNGLKKVVGRTLASAGEGAAYGAIEAYGHDDPISTGALSGAGGAALGNLAGETIFNPAVQHYLSSFAKNPIPKLLNATEDQIKGLNNEVQKSGITYGQPFKQDIMDYSSRNLPQNYSPQFQENIKAFRDDLNKIADDNIPVSEIRTLADRSRQLAKNTPIEERQYFDNIGNRVDRKGANPREGEFASGEDAAFAIYHQLNAVKEWLEKADAIQRMIDRGELRFHSPHENNGGHSQSLLKQLEKQQFKFTPDEVESFNILYDGTPLQKWLQPLTEEFAGSKNSFGYAARKQIHEKAIQPVAKKFSNLLAEKNNRELLGLALKGGDKKAVEEAPNMMQKIFNAYGPEVASYWGQKWLEDKLENSQP